MLSETRSRIDAGAFINPKYIKRRLSVLHEYIPRCGDAEQVAELRDEERLLRKYRKETKK